MIVEYERIRFHWCYVEVIILAGRTKGQMDVWWEGESSLEVVKHSGTNNQLSAPPALSPVWNHFSSPPPTHFLTLMLFLTHFLTLSSSPFYCVLTPELCSCSPVGVRRRFALLPFLLARTSQRICPGLRMSKNCKHPEWIDWEKQTGSSRNEKQFEKCETWEWNMKPASPTWRQRRRRELSRRRNSPPEVSSLYIWLGDKVNIILIPKSWYLSLTCLSSVKCKDVKIAT